MLYGGQLALYGAHGEYIKGIQLALATKKGTQIPNEINQERRPEILEAGHNLVASNHPEARLRVLTTVYNCLGMAFANRRTWIEPENLELILSEDGFRRLNSNEEILPGDILVYRNPDGAFAQVYQIQAIRSLFT